MAGGQRGRAHRHAGAARVGVRGVQARHDLDRPAAGSLATTCATAAGTRASTWTAWIASTCCVSGWSAMARYFDPLSQDFSRFDADVRAAPPGRGSCLAALTPVRRRGNCPSGTRPSSAASLTCRPSPATSGSATTRATPGCASSASSATCRSASGATSGSGRRSRPAGMGASYTGRPTCAAGRTRRPVPGRRRRSARSCSARPTRRRAVTPTSASARHAVTACRAPAVRRYQRGLPTAVHVAGAQVGRIGLAIDEGAWQAHRGPTPPTSTSSSQAVRERQAGAGHQVSGDPMPRARSRHHHPAHLCNASTAPLGRRSMPRILPARPCAAPRGRDRRVWSRAARSPPDRPPSPKAARSGSCSRTACGSRRHAPAPGLEGTRNTLSPRPGSRSRTRRGRHRTSRPRGSRTSASGPEKPFIIGAGVSAGSPKDARSRPSGAPAGSVMTAARPILGTSETGPAARFRRPPWSPARRGRRRPPTKSAIANWTRGPRGAGQPDATGDELPAERTGRTGAQSSRRTPVEERGIEQFDQRWVVGQQVAPDELADPAAWSRASCPACARRSATGSR